MDETLLCPDGIRYYTKSQQSGYHRGKGWDDGAGGQVKHIAIFYGDVIHSIQTSYEREGIVAMSRIHGGNHGNFEMVNLYNEPLTWVSGYYGSWCLETDFFEAIFEDEETAPYNYEKIIKSLKFGTDTRTYGPFGRESGETFSYKTSTEISGFHGCSSNAFLHAIGVYIRSPATCIITEPQMPIVKNFSLPEAKTLALPEAKTVPSTREP